MKPLQEGGNMKPLQAFKKYYKGQRVYYTGHTSYNNDVKNEPGTVIALGNSITVQLDNSLKPYRSKDGNTELPPPQIGNASVGDLKTKIKKIIPI